MCNGNIGQVKNWGSNTLDLGSFFCRVMSEYKNDHDAEPEDQHYYYSDSKEEHNPLTGYEHEREDVDLSETGDESDAEPAGWSMFNNSCVETYASPQSTRCLVKSFRKTPIALGSIRTNVMLEDDSYQIRISDIYDHNAELYEGGTFADI